MKVSELLEEYSKAGFGARSLGEAAAVYRKMLEDADCMKVLSASGSLVAGGLRNVFVDALRAGLVDACVFTTGSIIDHDLIEAFGVRHVQGEPDVDDAKLGSESVNRIYDVYLPNEGYEVLEKRLNEIFPKLPQKELSPMEFFSELGRHIDDENSILKTCSEMGVPVFDPGITDSMVGFHAWMYSQDSDFSLNPQLDIKEFLDMGWGKKYGLVSLGGGVPKHFVLAMMQITDNPLSYGIQISTSRPEFGGLSGASLRETKSWKKAQADALTVDVTCDATIAFPLLVAALLG